jgi:hypothetical protein
MKNMKNCGKKKWGNQILKIEKDRTQWQQRDKRISNDLHYIHRKLKIEQHGPH